MTQPTLPTKSLLQGAPYTPSHKTDIRQTFERVYQQQASTKEKK